MDSISENIVNIIGYHGTDGDSIEKIDIEGFRFLNIKPESWVGDGVYFFQSAKEMEINGFKEAENWAKRKVKHSHGSWAVFEAHIKSQKVFDSFGKEEHRKLFESIKFELIKMKKEMENIGNQIKIKPWKDFYVYQQIESEKFFEVFRILAEGRNKNSYSSYTIERPQIIICVKEIKCIDKYNCVKRGKVYER